MGLYDGLLGSLFAASNAQQQQRNMRYDEQLQGIYHSYLSGGGPQLSTVGGLGNYYNYGQAYHKPKHIKCRYCGNKYSPDIKNRHYNCPTCAGGWED